VIMNELNSLLFVIICVLSIVTISSLNNGLARTPQMAWNSWNYFGCNINETLVLETAELLKSTGLHAVGYDFINMDDCWQGSRDNFTHEIQPDPKAFPNGIGALASKIHSLGLKFGLYSDAGLFTCEGRPGSLGYEQIDAKTYVKWGVDYLKYDNCHDNNTDPETRYPRMSQALNETGASILFSMCEWGIDDPATWAPKLANSWRTTQDINDQWETMMRNIRQNDIWSTYSGPGQWNDADMLEVGNGGMSNDEYRTHFSLWSLVKSPLILGNNLKTITQSTLEILTNTEIIAINQDSLGVQGNLLVANYAYQYEIWGGPLSNNEYVACIVNIALNPQRIAVNFTEIGFGSGGVNLYLRDLWAHKSLGAFQGYYTTPPLNSHASMVLKASFQPI